MDKKKLGYILVASTIVFGCIYIYKKNNIYVGNSAKNDPTKAGMPYSLDLTKIINVKRYIGGDFPQNALSYNDDAGKYKNNLLVKKNDGYYLYSGNISYLYDLNTGAFLRTSMIEQTPTQMT